MTYVNILGLAIILILAVLYALRWAIFDWLDPRLRRWHRDFIEWEYAKGYIGTLEYRAECRENKDWWNGEARRP